MSETISLQVVVDHQRKSQLTLIGIHYPTTIYTEDYGYELAGTAHSILIYGPPTEAGNYYVFKTYDPNGSECCKTQNFKGLYKLYIGIHRFQQSRAYDNS